MQEIAIWLKLLRVGERFFSRCLDDEMRKLFSVMRKRTSRVFHDEMVIAFMQ